MTMLMCSIRGCDGEVHARGWCMRHYGIWYRTGVPYEAGDPFFTTPGYDEEAESRRLDSLPSFHARGEARKGSKLTKDKVREIRARYKPGLGAKLAREFGVTTKTIHDIVTRTTWKHVK